MAAETPPGGEVISSTPKSPKPDPDHTNVDPDPERSADREAVALAMVTELTRPTGTPPLLQNSSSDMLEILVQRKKQRKRPREDEKICVVCGDSALAHNFDAITCESCKAFFRRNALRPERMMCQFKGDCIITIQTRRFCPCCRLQKCFAVGMKADLILGETERKIRMDKVSENRAKRQAKDKIEPSNLEEFQVGSSSNPMYTVVTVDEFKARSKQSKPVVSTPPPVVCYTEVGSQALQHAASQSLQQKTPESVKNSLKTLHAVLTAAPAFSISVASPVLNAAGSQQKKPSWPFSHATSQSTQQPPAPSPSQAAPPTSKNSNSTGSKNSNSTGSASVTAPSRADFQHVPRDVLPSDPHMYWRLSEEEKTLLTQLSSAYQDTIMTLPERVPCEALGHNGDLPGVQSLESIFETAEKNTRQLINFVQRLGDFHMLREDDKIAVLQASGMRSVILRWTALYVVERNTWLTRFGESGVATVSVIFGHKDIIQDMAEFCRSMKTILKNDVTLFVLTHCLILFDPREQNLVDRQLINTFRDKYVILLKHYLESEYSFLYTERYLQAVLDKIVEIRHVADKCMGIMKEFRDYVPPLMKQLLNLQENS